MLQTRKPRLGSARRGRVAGEEAREPDEEAPPPLPVAHPADDGGAPPPHARDGVPDVEPPRRAATARATPASKAVRANVSLALEQTKARGPRSVASTLAREIDLTTEACPGLSFCEFVDALLSVADGAIGARGRLKALYPTPHDRAVALLAVWGAADPNKFDLVAGCVASHCHANTGEHR
ncbi:hypothetical protein JL720_17404 [Aureococcus anophagefferens]|nr:hypothetical protein JL720_17404 [Aureococcus anophagefferens]